VLAGRRVWTLTDEGEPREERLFLHREGDGDVSYFLSNASGDTKLETLALIFRWPMYENS